MVNDVKLKKCFMSKDQIQAIVKKIWFKDKVVD